MTHLADSYLDDKGNTVSDLMRNRIEEVKYVRLFVKTTVFSMDSVY